MNSKIKNERILVTGAHGFIGRALVSFLRSHGEEDIWLLGKEIVDGPNIVSCDLNNVQQTAETILAIKPTQIYHLAGSFTNVYSDDYKSNVVTTVNIFDALMAHKITARVLLFGSASEYGSPEKNPVNEEQPLRPLSVYGLTKAYQTLTMNYYHSVYALDIVMARTFNLYGEGVSRQLFAGKIYEQVMNCKNGLAKQVVVENLGVQRDFLRVQQAVGYYHLIMNRGVSGEVYNVGSGVPMSGKLLIEQIMRDMGMDLSSCEIAEKGEKMSVPDIYADTRKLIALESNM